MAQGNWINTVTHGTKPPGLKSQFCLLPALALKQETETPAFCSHEAGAATTLLVLVYQVVKELKLKASWAPMMDASPQPPRRKHWK